MVPALGIELSSNAYKAIASPFMLYGLIMAESKGIEPSNSYERRRFSRPFVPMDARLRISKLSKNWWSREMPPLTPFYGSTLLSRQV